MNGEFRKMEKELREFCGGNIIVIPGEEEKYLRRGRTRILGIKKKQKKERDKVMGGIGRIRRIIRAIFEEEKPKQDN